MSVWQRLLDYTETLGRGTLLHCVLEEAPTILLLRDDGALIPLTGQEAGTSMFHIPYGGWVSGRLSSRWVVEHWTECVPSSVDNVLVRHNLDARELQAATHIPLVEFTGTLERGRLLEFPFGYPFEGKVYMMVTDYDTRFSFMAITGYKAGVRAWWVPPPEAASEFGIDARWLATNEAMWSFDGARSEDVSVRDPLTVRELHVVSH